MQRNFEVEREQARQEAERLVVALQAYGYEVGEIDWQSAGRLADIVVNGVNVGSIISVGGSDERGHLREDVSYKLLEAAAQQLLQDDASAVSWSPLELPEDAPDDLQSLWRVHLGEDERPGINIAEVVRGGKRLYEYFPGGAQPGVHSFPVDKISVKAIQLIKEQGGIVTYNPRAQRADDIQGRRQVVLPEGTWQIRESEAFMASQRFVLPSGEQLRLVPEWYTVELDVVSEEQGQ